MSSRCSSLLPTFTNWMTDGLFYKELVNSEYLTDDDCNDLDENFYDLNELEEVFSDHILMGKRLQRSLYRGSTEDMDDDTDHPPIALTDLALRLFSKSVPNYGLDQLDMDYVSSVSESTRVSPCAMILALIYLERLQVKNGDYLESVSPSGLFVVTMLAASKFLFENEDDVVTNQIWSEALNMDVKELNQLEQKFLAAIDWQLYVDSSEFFQYLSSVEKMIALKQTSIRGWLSYSDMCSILQDAVIRKSIISCIEIIIKVSAISAVSYALAVLSFYTAGYTIHCRHNENQSSLKENIQIKSDIQRPFLEHDNTGLEHNTKLPLGESSGIEAIISSFSLEYRNTDSKISDFSCVFQNKNYHKNLSFKKYPVTTYNRNPVSSSKKTESQFRLYTYYNSFQNNIVNYTVDTLEWWPTTFRNTCIPVSVK